MAPTATKKAAPETAEQRLAALERRATEIAGLIATKRERIAALDRDLVAIRIRGGDTAAAQEEADTLTRDITIDERALAALSDQEIPRARLAIAAAAKARDLERATSIAERLRERQTRLAAAAQMLDDDLDAQLDDVRALRGVLASLREGGIGTSRSFAVAWLGPRLEAIASRISEVPRPSARLRAIDPATEFNRELDNVLERAQVEVVERQRLASTINDDHGGQHGGD